MGNLYMEQKISLFIPGRLCLFGEHSDWAGLMRIMNSNISPGKAIVVGTEEGIYADVEKSDKFSMKNISTELQDIWVNFECDMKSESLEKIAQSETFFSYVSGVASYMSEMFCVGGLSVTITKMTLPIKSGLSSSAAICVLVARAFNILYGLNMNVNGEMYAAFRGEQKTKSRCGRLDQACALGSAPVSMCFDGDQVDFEKITVKKDLHLVIADLCEEKDTIGILSDLNKCYPFPRNEVEYSVHDALGEKNNDIIKKAKMFIENGDEEALGKLMVEAQNLFDRQVAPASPLHLFAPKLHSVLNDKNIKDFVYGGKGVGSQGDGSVQFLAKDLESQKALMDYLKKINLNPYSLTIKAKNKVHKAIIPVAGFGTRLYPLTRSMKKEFIPIVDKDGLLKPVILILLEQLYDSGVDEICIVVRSDEDKKAYNQYFSSTLSDEHLSKLPKSISHYENKILEIGKIITYIIQEERKGLGHAVYQCRDFCNNGPVLLLLGDTIYSSKTKETCSQQLINAYNKLGKPLVSIHETPLEQVFQYGILSGEWSTAYKNVLEVKRFVEKPSVEFAKKNLATKLDNQENAYYSVFGQYVLTNDVFEELEKIISTTPEDSGIEIQITDAMAALIGKCGLNGVLLDGKMFDVGNVAAYRNTFGGY